MNIRCIGALFSAALLVGCATGADYQPPTVRLDESWHTNAEEHITYVSDWWGKFHDPSLASLQTAAHRNSNSLDKAFAAINKARAGRSSAEADLWPKVSTEIGATKSGSLRNEESSYSVSAGLDASWELDLFGKTRAKIASGDALIASKEAEMQGVSISLSAEVASDYVDYRACQVKQRYYEDQLHSQEKTNELTQLSANYGYTSRSDARLILASTDNTKATLLAQKTECEVLIKTLVSLTGENEYFVRDALSLAPTTLPQSANLGIATVPADLLRQRPDVVAAERSLASAYALVGSAEAARWPTVSLGGTIGLSKSQGITLTVPWSYGPSVTLPIFDGGSIKANIEDKQADYDSALAAYRQTIRDAVKEVEQALVRLENASEREIALQQSAEGYHAYLIACEENQKAGRGNQLDLEVARRAAIAAEMDLIEMQQNRLNYGIALYKAVGGDWNKQASLPSIEKNLSQNK